MFEGVQFLFLYIFMLNVLFPGAPEVADKKGPVSEILVE
jgi:hypothetical protein